MRRLSATMPWWCLAAVALALVSMIGSVGVGVMRARGTADVRGTRTPSLQAEIPAPDERMAPDWWGEPVQVDGRHGELFTLPSLVYDEASARFLPPSTPEAAAPPAEIVLELLGVEGDVYPLQLIGHVGSGASLRGIFVCPASGETVVAGTGHVFTGLGLSVQSLRLRRSSEAGRREAVAVVRDALSGQQVGLHSGQPLVSGAARARVRVVADNRILEVSEGALMEIRGWAYRVIRVHGKPASVEVLPATDDAPAIVWRSGHAEGAN